MPCKVLMFPLQLFYYFQKYALLETLWRNALTVDLIFQNLLCFNVQVQNCVNLTKKTRMIKKKTPPNHPREHFLVSSPPEHPGPYKRPDIGSFQASTRALRDSLFHSPSWYRGLQDCILFLEYVSVTGS